MSTLPLAEVRAQLSRLVEDAERTHERVEITKNGRRAAVLLSAEDYDSLVETLDILADPNALAALREAEADIEDARIFTANEVEKELRGKGLLR